jgi:hypothetical protein
MAQRVFLVRHARESYDGIDDIKFIGVYSTEKKAQLAVEHAKTLPGFKETPDGFHVEGLLLNRSGWLSGFVTVHGAPKRRKARAPSKSTTRKRTEKAGRAHEYLPRPESPYLQRPDSGGPSVD